jgi:type I restriction enzyme M protein
MPLQQILQDSNYKLTQFKSEYIKELEDSIFEKEVRGKKAYFVTCLVRKKDIQIKPEEVVRQLFLLSLYKGHL